MRLRKHCRRRDARMADTEIDDLARAIDIRVSVERCHFLAAKQKYAVVQRLQIDQCLMMARRIVVGDRDEVEAASGRRFHHLLHSAWTGAAASVGAAEAV